MGKGAVAVGLISALGSAGLGFNPVYADSPFNFSPFPSSSSTPQPQSPSPATAAPPPPPPADAKTETRVHNDQPRTVSAGFDPEALERGAKALREINSSSHAKKVFEVMKKQEETRQTELAAKAAEFKAMQAQAETERQRVIYDEQRKLSQQQAQIKSQMARYEDELARKRMQAENEHQRARNQELVKMQEDSANRQEQARRATEEQIQAQRRQTEREKAEIERETIRVRAMAEAEGRAHEAKLSEEVNRNMLVERANAEREKWVAAINTTFDHIGGGLRAILTDQNKLVVAVGGVTALAAGVYTTREGARVIWSYVDRILGQPSLIRESSRGKYPWSGLFSRGLSTLSRESKNGNGFGDVILNPPLQKRIQQLATATANTKSHQAPFRNMLFHGPPGTGKTMAARELARKSGLDYALMTGGDVAPLGSQAVTKIHQLFDWAKKSKRGLLLFIDEADAFLCETPTNLTMGLEKKVRKFHKIGKNRQAGTLSSHTFNDLTHVSPLVFLYLLKECYFRGTCNAQKRFRVFQQQIHLILYNAPRPGPAIFIARCLYILPMLEYFSEGFSHLILSSLGRFLKTVTTPEDLVEAKDIVSQLALNIISGDKIHDENLLIKILEIYNINLKDIEKATGNVDSVMVKYFIEKYICELIESKSYVKAVALLEHFCIRHHGESFLFQMMESKEYRAAEKWAAFMGKTMLCVLVKEFVNVGLFKNAYGVIKENNLEEEFPEVYYKYKESSLKKLAEKGCWDVAEERTHSNRQLLEYLVYLAMEAGYPEKVDELCDRYSLKGFTNNGEPEASLLRNRYLQFSEMGLEDIIWVDESTGLEDATCHFEGCKVVGLDCEWKPNYLKGSKPNKVSIMQIASEKRAYIIDLIKLFEDVPDILDSCLSRIFHSPRILKLGYKFQCDVQQLARSYVDLQCFKHYEMLLDIQNVFKEPRGGLSGLAEKILGASLNKTRRNSNWELRPLSPQQLEYAALDAAVLIHIFRHVRGHPQTDGVSTGRTTLEWKSYIISHMDKPKNTKKVKESKKKCNAAKC